MQRVTLLPSQKGYSLSQKRIPLLQSPEKDLHWQLAGRRGAAPAEWKCLLRFAAIRLGLLLSSLPLCLRFATLTQSPSTTDFYKLAFACQGGIASLAAVGTIENARIVDSRKLDRTKTRYAERQRIIEAGASRMSTHPMAASEAMPPRRHYLCPAHAVSLTCKLPMRAFLLGDIKGAVLFREREQPPLPVQRLWRCLPFP